MKYAEIDKHRIIILQKTYNPGALHQTSDTHQTEIHTFFIWYPRVGREHNSPSGNETYCKFIKVLGFADFSLYIPLYPWGSATENPEVL